MKAIALKYEEKTDKAPVLVAKGAGKFAEKIVAVGKQHNVPVVEDRILMELLFPLNPGETIPKELYMPVAKILAFVWTSHQKKEVGEK